jgi:formamidopyrimidine-DNA glycosylase
MPELPELQALAERMDRLLAGRTLVQITALQFSAAKTFDPPATVLEGAELTRVTRRGKYLVLDFSGTRLMIHLSQGGRVEFEEPVKKSRPKGGVVRFAFDRDVAILVKEFGTQRKAGWWVVAPGSDGPLEGLGPEPFDEAFTELLLSGHDKRRLHTFLRDQRSVAGIGRGFTDDALHRAQLSPFATLDQLGLDERTTLLEAIREVLANALESERKRSGGLPPKLGDRFTIHNRAGQQCPRCGADLRRVSFESYEMVYCPACQTGGKVLADRRMSRLIK